MKQDFPSQSFRSRSPFPKTLLSSPPFCFASWGSTCKVPSLARGLLTPPPTPHAMFISLVMVPLFFPFKCSLCYSCPCWSSCYFCSCWSFCSYFPSWSLFFSYFGALMFLVLFFALLILVLVILIVLLFVVFLLLQFTNY